MLRVNSYSINNFKSQTTQQRSTAFNPAKLSIYYYNDTHGNSDQIAGIMESAKHFRKHNKDTVNFVLSAGDNVSGADAQKNGFIFDLMQNMMGVDVSAIGNHEIDAGSKGFHQAAKDKKIQFIATNIELDDDNPMKEFVRKSTIKEQNGVRYGFIGAMPIDFKTCTKKQVQEGIEVLDFEDTVEELQEEIDELRKQNIDKIILVSHVGYETDKKYNVIMGPTMKVRKKGTWMEEVNFLLKNRCKGGDGIFVDVIIYDNIAESKLTDQIHRTFMKLLMPIYVLLDNLRIPHDSLSRFIRWYANKYSRRHENSSLVSQPISVPWEKFLKEPIFKKEDVYPFKLYEFEGRKYYSYNNIEKILKQWYGPNCLKKWDGYIVWNPFCRLFSIRCWPICRILPFLLLGCAFPNSFPVGSPPSDFWNGQKPGAVRNGTHRWYRPSHDS